MKFAELDQRSQIKKVKEKFVDILKELHNGKVSLDKYMPLPKAPDAKDEAALKEYEKQKALYSSVAEQIARIKEKPSQEEVGAELGCICTPRCLTIDTDIILTEFEPFIDYARKRAETSED